MAFAYMQAPTLLGVGKITVTMELPAAGGLYRFSNVTYRGVQMGKVTEVALTPTGAKATLRLNTSPKIPANLQADVRSVSAVGEQYVDLRPRTNSGPYLKNGSVIPMSDTTIPQDVGPMLDQVSALINSVPKDRLSDLLDESYKGLNGAGYDLGSLFDSSAKVSGDVNGVADQTRTLVDDSGPLLDSQAETTDAIRTWARSLANITQTVADDDRQVRTILQTGQGAADEASALLTQVKPTLPVLLANLTSTGQVITSRIDGLRSLLILYPATLAGAFTVTPGDGTEHFGLVLNLNTPPPCTKGYEKTKIRFPQDTTTVRAQQGVGCKLPRDSQQDVRGARNAPPPRPAAGSKSRRLTNLQASSAPNSRSTPASLNSTAKGPS
jgi:virulence factor Mce-like protein